MPAMTAKPALRKSKSNLRQRLGLTSAPKQPALLSPVPSPSSTNLASSTSTSASATSHASHVSRADSRSAFTYDSATPSPPGKGRAEFDTVSYNSQMSEVEGQTPDREHAGVNASASTLVSSGESSDVAYADADAEADANNDTRGVTPYQPPAQYGAGGEEDTLHPNIANATSGVDDIFSLTDQQLSDRFTFISEIGFGNWGSVWLCKPKHVRSSQLGEAGVAIKLVHRSKTVTTAARVRALWGEMKIIRALRHEPHPSIIQFEAFVITPSYALVIMPHLSHLIPVCLPPSRATPYFRQLASAVGYLHERGITHNDIKPANVLLSHNDVPVLVDFGFAQKWEVGGRGSFLSSISWGTPEYLDPQRAKAMPHDERASDVWSLGITMFEILIGRTPFEADDQEQFSTPEELVIYYERSKRGDWVGEWSMPEDIEGLLRQMINPDPAHRITAMDAYHHQALQPSAPSVIITPHFIRAAASFDVVDEPVPAPEEFTQAVAAANAKQSVGEPEKDKKRKTKRKVKKDAGQTVSARASTPALGESIKQHTSAAKPKRAGEGPGDKENAQVYVGAGGDKGSKLVIKGKRNEEEREKDGEEEDPTPTKMTKPAQPLRIKELSFIADKKVVPRTSNSQLSSLSRPGSAASGTSKDLSRTTSTQTLKETSTAKELSRVTSTQTLKDKRVSALSGTSVATSATATAMPKTKEDAVLRTMRSLEGTRKHFSQAQKEKAQEALAAIRRPAPSPPRPKSLDSAVETAGRKDKVDERRSLGLDRAVLVKVKEEEVDIKVKDGGHEVDAVIHFQHEKKAEAAKAPPISPPRAQRSRASRMPTPSPQKSRRQGIRPHAELNAATGKVFPASDDESPLAELRDKILVSDQEKLVRFRQVSGDLVETLKMSTAPAPTEKAAAAGSVRSAVSSRAPTPTESIRTAEVEAGSSMPTLSRTKSVEALAMDSRLDKMATWIKDVEHIVEEARRALAEGREPGLPVLTLPTEITGDAQEHRFGVTPDKPGVIPVHLRTSSTQVEPSTPPKWMTYAEAEEKVKAANAWMEEQGRRGKKERPSVGHVLKLFGGEKEKAPSRSGTPDPAHTLIPLKPPAHTLRGVPSTPALRSSTTRQPSRVPHRKSESNLRNFNTMPVIPSPSFVAGPEYDPDADEDHDVEYAASPRRVRYENMLAGEPGVVRQGDGWSSFAQASGSGRGVKPSSSMASLRERARALLGDSRERHIVDLAKEPGAPNPHQKLEKRSSRLTLRGGNTGAEKREAVKAGDREENPARSGTPAAQSVLTMRTGAGGDKKVKGWVKSLKGAMGMGKREEF
ncbi:hypothetical protein IAT38_006549 [Cryptococcus sp. DSM 104549]